MLLRSRNASSTGFFGRNTVATTNRDRLQSLRATQILGHMRTLLCISTLCLVLVGCATASRDVRAVWIQPTLPPADLLPPSGFTVTPAQAISAARKSGALSPKHVWHVYSDSDYYYLHDAFLGDSPRRAYAQGVRIDGRTGEIVRR